MASITLKTRSSSPSLLQAIQAQELQLMKELRLDEDHRFEAFTGAAKGGEAGEGAGGRQDAAEEERLPRGQRGGGRRERGAPRTGWP